MKRFIKGTLETVVEDDDRRIPAYLANGWTEAELTKKPQDEADQQLDKAMTDVEESEGAADNGSGSKKPTKKVNDAIEANAAAAAESEAVDDGLLKKKGE